MEHVLTEKIESAWIQKKSRWAPVFYFGESCHVDVHRYAAEPVSVWRQGMTRARSPEWRLCGTVSCAESPLAAPSGVSAGYRTGIPACRPLLSSLLAGCTSSRSPFVCRYESVLRPADGAVRLEHGRVQNEYAVPPVRAAQSAQRSAHCAFFYLRNFDTKFPFTQRNAKAEGDSKSLWQASSAPLCLAFARSEAREGRPSRILSSYGNTAVDGMRGLYARMCCIAGRAGSF